MKLLSLTFQGNKTVGLDFTTFTETLVIFLYNGIKRKHQIFHKIILNSWFLIYV